MYSFSYFWFNYTIMQGNYHPWYRNYEDRQLVNIVRQRENAYKNVFLSNSSYTYFVLDQQISLQTLQTSYPHRLDKKFHLGKFTFVGSDCYITPQKDTLFAIKNT